MKRFLLLLLAGLTCFTACRANTPADTTTDKNTAVTTDQQQSSDSDIIPQDFSHLFAPAEREGTVKVNELSADGSYITGNYTRVDGETVQKYPRLTNLPTMYIDFPDGKQLSDVQHGVYTDATYTFVDEYVENSYYNLPLEIKGRGNFSWSFAQKPYSLKLGESADFLGMGAAKKWVLITVSSDKTMMHNYLTQKMAAAMGLRGTCENEYVDVVVNGTYKGTWVLTEKIQLHESRIDVPEDESTLFEIEMVYRHSCDLCIVMYKNERNNDNSVHLKILEYKGTDVEDMDQRTRANALEELKPFFEKLTTTLQNPRSTLSQLSKYIDVDSFVNWYLLNELTRNYDSMFVTSCYCYFDENGKIYMGPVWDYDTCYGIQYEQTDGYWITQAPWYDWLFENDKFVERVQKRWTEIRNNGLIASFKAAIDQTAERIAQSEQLNHTLYPKSELHNDSFEGACDYMKDWLDERISWMDGEFLIRKR